MEEGKCRMTEWKKLSIHNDLKDSDQLVPFIDEIGEELHLSFALTTSLNLALEEALVNSIQYAYADGVRGEISLTADWNKETSILTFVLKDAGKPFDPTQMPDADITLSVEDRPIGGLGILLIRKIMDKVYYQRIGNENHLVMAKKILID